MSLLIAVDAGATHTRTGLYRTNRALVAEAAGGGANPVDLGADRAAAVIAESARIVLQESAEPAACLAAAVSGAATPGLRQELAQALCRRLPIDRAIVSDDLRPLLWPNAKNGPALLVIAGTGSSVLAQRHDDDAFITGGRGSLFGEEGGAYGLALRGLRAAAAAIDGLGPDTPLVDALVDEAGLTSFADVPRWAAQASKAEIARLAAVVVNLAEEGDMIAAECLHTGIANLVRLTSAAVDRLTVGVVPPIFVHGALFDVGTYAQAFNATLRSRITGAEMTPLALKGHRAVLEMALRDDLPQDAELADAKVAFQQALAATEERRSGVPIDRLAPAEIVELMTRDAAVLQNAVLAEKGTIAQAIEWAAQALVEGGRIVYTGAGTSGRLGVLDASECPPTFGVPPTAVIGLIAGGDRALRDSVEGAEDDADLGAGDLAALDPGPKDVVIGISASGTAPYVRGALEAAGAAGARTVLLCCNPRCAVNASLRIAINSGPEVLAGSTRLKAGTATKMVLNMISTGAMARAGRVYEGYMVGVRPANRKLVDRAVRILAALTGVGDGEARGLLEQAGNDVPTALVMARKGLDAEAAWRALEAAGGHVRDVLDSE